MDTHPVLAAYAHFIWQYDHMPTHPESEIAQARGRRLRSSCVAFHVQLAWHSWLVAQLEMGEMGYIEGPEFFQGLNLVEVQNNLYGVVPNFPGLLALCTPIRAQAPDPPPDQAQPRAPIMEAAAVEAGGNNCCDPGPNMCNTNQDDHLIGNIPFTKTLTITTDRVPSPTVVRSGLSMSLGVPWHWKGVCFDFCGRCLDHGTLLADLCMWDEEAGGNHTHLLLRMWPPRGIYQRP
jgi:hypothetical protein